MPQEPEERSRGGGPGSVECPGYFCLEKETRNELMGLLWQQDEAPTSERKTKVYYDWVKPLIATLERDQL